VGTKLDSGASERAGVRCLFLHFEMMRAADWLAVAVAIALLREWAQAAEQTGKIESGLLCRE